MSRFRLATAAPVLLSRSYAVPAIPFVAVTADGVRLVGHRLGDGERALVFCHGFTGWHRKPRLVRFQEELARWFTVYAFDLRGHGGSDGLCALGAREHLDVDVVARLARERGHRTVVTLGASLGGVAVIRQAALCGGVDAVVAVSTPARWTGHQSRAARKLLWFTATRYGRALLAACGIRLSEEWHRTEEPWEVVGRIGPTPVVIVHGRDDHFFDEEEAWLLYRTAEEPKRLLLAGRFGHAEDGFTPAFAGELAVVIERSLTPRPAGAEGGRVATGSSAAVRGAP